MEVHLRMTGSAVMRKPSMLATLGGLNCYDRLPQQLCTLEDPEESQYLGRISAQMERAPPYEVNRRMHSYAETRYRGDLVVLRVDACE